jgi:hypothetical protein
MLNLAAARWLQAAAPAGWWRLVLLHADLVQETRQAGSAGAPPVQRVVSSSPAGLSRARSASLPLDGSALELPPAIQRLVLDSPHILTEDTAARFLLGLGHADKAYEALSKMVLWVSEKQRRLSAGAVTQSRAAGGKPRKGSRRLQGCGSLGSLICKSPCFSLSIARVYILMCAAHSHDLYCRVRRCA